MRKPLDAGERSTTVDKAILAQARHLSGPAGTSKDLATSMQRVLCEPIDGKVTIGIMNDRIRRGEKDPSHIPPDELLEAQRRAMIERLQDPNSDFFWYLNDLTTALKNRDSKFFRQIANGLDQGRTDMDPMEFLHRAYFHWMFPSNISWYTVWTHPTYQRFVENGIEPTKQQMRELTERFWAIERLWKRKALQRPCYANEQQPPDIERKISKEIANLPKQKWARLWKAAGLEHLKEGRSGPKPK